MQVDTVVHVYNPRTRQVEAEGSGIQGHLLAHSESKDCWPHKRAETTTETKASQLPRAMAACATCW